MISNGKKLHKSASGNTALDKESIVELMKTVFLITGILKTAVANIKNYWKQPGNHEARNWKATRRDKRFEKSIEFTENVLEKKIAKVEQNVCELQGKCKKVEEDVTYMNDYIKYAENIHNKLVELEDRSREIT